MKIKNLHLFPLPKKITIKGERSLDPETLVIVKLDDDIWVQRAAEELVQFIRNQTGVEINTSKCSTASNCICLASEFEQKTYRNLFQDTYFTKSITENRFQKYYISVLSSANGLVIQGMQKEGVYWGMKTLKQLLRFENGKILLPDVSVCDSADMEQRGIWAQPFGDTCPDMDVDSKLSHYKQWIDWLSDRKINLFEVIVMGDLESRISFHSKRYPEFENSSIEEHDYLLHQLTDYACEKGVQLIPTISHPEHFKFISEKYPKLKARNSLAHHGTQIQLAVNMFDEKVLSVLKNLTEELVEKTSPLCLCFWVAENRLHSLPPEEQNVSEFVREISVFYKIIEFLRKKNPELEIKILLSQGSACENLELIRSLPKNVKWIYYNGERSGTYTVSHRNPISSDISCAASEGYWISLCNAIRGVPARSAVLQKLYNDIAYAIQAGLKGIDGMSYAFPGDKIALFILAEQSWNNSGRTFEETIEAFAISEGIAEPEIFTKNYKIYDNVNWLQANLNSTGVGHPFGNFSRYFNMLERIKNNSPVDELIMKMVDTMQADEIPALQNAIDDMAKMITGFDINMNDLYVKRYIYLLHEMQITLDIVRAFYINCREKCCDVYKGPWKNYKTEMKSLFENIIKEGKRSSSIFNDIIKMEMWGPYWSRKGNPLEKIADFVETIDSSQIRSSKEITEI